VARHTVLDVMLKALPESRKEVSQFAPKVMVITVPKDKIGEVIGPGGKNIRGMSAQTETDINIEEDGTVTITGLHKEKVEEAANIISSMTREVEVGEEFTGVVKRMLPFGAFVEILPGKEGLVHVSKMGAGFVRTPEDVVSIGQEVKVKVYEVDTQGRINLMMEGARVDESRPEGGYRDQRPSRGDDRRHSGGAQGRGGFRRDRRDRRDY
jgi:polyribonucleotide nucleotidyltransferase